VRALSWSGAGAAAALRSFVRGSLSSAGGGEAAARVDSCQTASRAAAMGSQIENGPSDSKSLR